MTATYTMPEILMAIAAIGVVLNSAIQQWRSGTKIEQTLISAKVTEGHVNSKETKYVEELASARRENDLLRQVIVDKDVTAAMLAQAVATRAQPAPVPAEQAADVTLDKIEINTDATAKNTARTDVAVADLQKHST